MSVWDLVSPEEAQRRVDAYFATRVTTWAQIYTAEGLVPLIHQQRRTIALRWIEELALAPGERVLEVGCGAGLTTVTLARRGFGVDALDGVGNMVECTRRAATEAGVGHMVKTSQGDAHDLTFPDATFQLVLAVGVLQWLHTPRRALCEMARVVKPGGHVLVTAHNRWRLVDALDPWLSPPLDPLRRAAGAALRRLGVRHRPPYLEPVAQVVSAAELARWFLAAGLRQVKGMTLGFGPFTLFSRSPFSDATGVKLHRFLQRWADRNVPVVRSIGAQHIILAQKPADGRGGPRDRVRPTTPTAAASAAGSWRASPPFSSQGA